MRTFNRILAAGLLVGGSLAVPAAQTAVVSFTINDPSSTGAGVFSDSQVTFTNSYADYRIDPAPPLNWCVDAEAFSPGNLFVRLNRKLDGEAGTMRCTDNLNPDTGLPGAQRNFVLRIANDAVCDILADSSAGLPLTDSAELPWNPVSSSGLCVLARNDNPRIRLATLYKARAKSTTVDFLTTMFEGTNSYEIRSESAATISSTGPGHKAIAYSGTFRLVKFEPGKKAYNVGPSFTMPLSIDFQQ